MRKTLLIISHDLDGPAVLSSNYSGKELIFGMS